MIIIQNLVAGQIMMKMLVLQSWYGLSDPELERQATDRISFRKFLGFPERIPDRSTVWAFRERLIDTGKDERIWEELQRQIDTKGLKIKEGVIQDATFITADPGHKKVEEPRGPTAKTRRNKDGEWTKKNGKSHYGYKLHSKMDIDHQLIREIETTPASVHDSQIDLTKPREVLYRDRAYFGAPCKGYNATMKRATRGINTIKLEYLVWIQYYIIFIMVIMRIRIQIHRSMVITI
jgi:IS5 family transposase